MSFIRSTKRGRERKYDPISFFIAYEGASDEKEYFEALKHKVPKQFSKLLNIIPVEKSSTNAAPNHVLNDLDDYLKSNNIKAGTNGNYAFIVIDKDKYFSDTHLSTSTRVLQECRQKGIEVICNSPSFDVWLLLHFVQLHLSTTEYKEAILRNQKVTNKTFTKKEVSKYKNGKSYGDLLNLTGVALENEENLSPLDANLPAEHLHSCFRKLFNKMKKSNVYFLDSDE